MDLGHPYDKKVKMSLNSKKQATYDRVWSNPTRKDIEFEEIKKLLVSLGCTLKQGSGSRVSFIFGPHRLKMHQPHSKSGKSTLKNYQIEDIREFLTKTEHNIYGKTENEEPD